MVSKEFVKQYKGLNPSQKEAVDSIEGAVMVVAGPGTGKTKALTLRIANILLKTQVNPENILALTFTESAAHEMRKRLLSIIGHDAYRVDITTFHSFCNNFIKRHQEEFSHIISSDNINEIDQLEIIQECIKKLNLIILKPLGDLSYYVQPAMRMIVGLKQENVSPSDLKKGLENFEKDLNSREDLIHDKGAHKGNMKSQYKKQFDNLKKNKELLMVYRAYQQSLSRQKKYDYNDMLLEVIKKLSEHEYLLQFLQEKYQYFLVDEHQDTNAAQNKIVELITDYFDNPNLFIVGDEKQAIFRFQGATLTNFYMFREKYPDAKFINLSENYRSTKNILDASFALISNNPQITNFFSVDHSLKKNIDLHEEKIHISALNSEYAEAQFIGETIMHLLNKTQGNEVAVLVRNNKDVEPFISVFERMKIPYVMQADSDVMGDIDVQKLILLLRSITKQNNENLERALLLDCFKIAPLDAFKINRAVYEKKLQVWDLLTDKSLLDGLSLINRQSVNDFVELFLGENGFIKSAVNERFDVLFVDVLNKSGLINTILQKPNGQEILNRITRLYDEVKNQVARNPHYTIINFIKFIELLNTHKVTLKSNSTIIPENSVRIMTVHKSKGLEFDYVFLVKAYDGHWGNKHKYGSKFNIPWEYLINLTEANALDDENVDERKLFYVAMTRARKNIFITYSTHSSDGREQIPSQFISEIPEGFIKIEDSKEFETQLLLHQENLLLRNNIDKRPLATPEYVKELFNRQGLSVSALNNYLKCPWKFFFVNLLRLPEKIENSNLFGSAIHSALSEYIIQLKKGNNPTKDLLIKKFEYYFDRLPFSGLEKKRFKQRGIDGISGFFDDQMKSWGKELETEIEIRGIRINDDVILTGKIDMIRPTIDKKFDVIDFKTGKPKSRNVIEGKVKNGDGNYKRQLVFYKLLLDRYRNGFFKMTSGIIEFVEPNEKGEYKREAFNITVDESNELLKQIEIVGKEIVLLSFWNKKCKDQDCEYCRLRDFIGK